MHRRGARRCAARGHFAQRRGVAAQKGAGTEAANGCCNRFPITPEEFDLS